MTAPLDREAIVFIVLREDERWRTTPVSPGDTIFASVEVFDVKKTISLTIEEFNTLRAKFVLMGLEDPAKWAAFISDRLFPSDQELSAGSFSV